MPPTNRPPGSLPPPPEKKQPNTPGPDYNDSLARGVTNPTWRKILEATFGLPFHLLGKAIELATKRGLTVHEAVEEIKKDQKPTGGDGGPEGGY